MQIQFQPWTGNGNAPHWQDCHESAVVCPSSWPPSAKRIPFTSVSAPVHSAQTKARGLYHGSGGTDALFSFPSQFLPWDSAAKWGMRFCLTVDHARSSLRIAKTYIEGKRRALRLAVIEHWLRNDDWTPVRHNFTKEGAQSRTARRLGETSL